MKKGLRDMLDFAAAVGSWAIEWWWLVLAIVALGAVFGVAAATA